MDKKHGKFVAIWHLEGMDIRYVYSHDDNEEPYHEMMSITKDGNEVYRHRVPYKDFMDWVQVLNKCLEKEDA